MGMQNETDEPHWTPHSIWADRKLFLLSSLCKNTVEPGQEFSESIRQSLFQHINVFYIHVTNLHIYAVRLRQEMQGNKTKNAHPCEIRCWTLPDMLPQHSCYGSESLNRLFRGWFSTDRRVDEEVVYEDIRPPHDKRHSSLFRRVKRTSDVYDYFESQQNHGKQYALQSILRQHIWSHWCALEFQTAADSWLRLRRWHHCQCSFVSMLFGTRSPILHSLCSSAFCCCCDYTLTSAIQINSNVMCTNQTRKVISKRMENVFVCARRASMLGCSHHIIIFFLFSIRFSVFFTGVGGGGSFETFTPSDDTQSYSSTPCTHTHVRRTSTIHITYRITTQNGFKAEFLQKASFFCRRRRCCCFFIEVYLC